MLFGDGAGSMILTADNKKNGVLSSKIYSDGAWMDSLYADGGPSINQRVGKIRMKGQDIFKQAVNKLSQSTLEALNDCDLSINDIDWFVPHQANIRILESVAKKVGLSEDKIIITVQKHANTSAASIPLALFDAVQEGKIKKGDLVLLEAMGGGFSWGSTLIRW